MGLVRKSLQRDIAMLERLAVKSKGQVANEWDLTLRGLDSWLHRIRQRRKELIWYVDRMLRLEKQNPRIQKILLSAQLDKEEEEEEIEEKVEAPKETPKPTPKPIINEELKERLESSIWCPTEGWIDKTKCDSCRIESFKKFSECYATRNRVRLGQASEQEIVLFTPG